LLLGFNMHHDIKIEVAECKILFSFF
jgi:hypothetical protein